MTLSLSLVERLGLKAYEIFWFAGAPLAALNRRLRQGHDRRKLPADWGCGGAWQDVWIQAASAGEAYLAWELLRELNPDRKMNLLLTTNTCQGMDILDKAKAWAAEHRPLARVRLEYFPFDSPAIMRRALQQTLVKTVVLLETELWPGLLAACAEEGVPVLVINARMRTRSLSHYLLLARFFRKVAPRAILAISEEDAGRYRVLFGSAGVETAHNLKFDRLTRDGAMDYVDNPLSWIIRPTQPFAVFGSVRSEEEFMVDEALGLLLAERPMTVVGLAPRHLHRLEAWEARLNAAGRPWVRRAALAAPPAPGTVILWDVFGELSSAYALARTVFVGGTLAPLGGQNFLEPLAQGIVPIIGPHWSNFAWVGEEIVREKLVQVVGNPGELAQEMIKQLKRPQPRDRVLERFHEFLEKRSGGARRAMALIEAQLSSPGVQQ